MTCLCNCFFFCFFPGTSKTTASGTTSLQRPIKTEKSTPGTVLFSFLFFYIKKCPLEGSGNVVASSQRRAWCSDETKVNQKDTREEYTAMAVSLVLFRMGDHRRRSGWEVFTFFPNDISGVCPHKNWHLQVMNSWTTSSLPVSVNFCGDSIELK